MIEQASLRDLEPVLDLLRQAGLPTAGVADHFHHFIVAHVEGLPGGTPVGCAGLEVYARQALLRSLVVHPGHRGRGSGRHLVRKCLEKAQELGVEDVYLLEKDGSWCI